MKRNHILFAILAVLVLSLTVFACASAAEVRPIPLDHDTLDLENGTFRLAVRNTNQAKKGEFFTAVLYLEDHYDGEQIRSLVPGDTVFADDRAWTVREVVIHRNDEADESAEYEIYPEEDLDGYLVFVPREDGTYVSLMNDWNPITLAGSVRVNLPLPDDFEYIRDEESLDAQTFINDLDPDMSPYGTTCEFRDGTLVRVTANSYPYGPQEDDSEGFRAVPVWKFCHGFRDNLDTAVITCSRTDCEEGLIPVEMTPEEAENIRRLAMYGTVTEKASDEMLTGGTWVYYFETPGGTHLLSIELYSGMIVGSDGMYNFEQ